MTSYIKYLALSLMIFAVLYLGLTTIVSRTIVTTPSSAVVNIINVLAYLCWVISAYIFAASIKKCGYLNGIVLGIFTLLIIIPANIRLITNESVDIYSFFITYIGIGFTFGIIGGGIYDIQRFVKRKSL